MTPLQSRALHFIKTFWHLNQYSPSIREVAEAVSRQPSHTHKAVKALERAGYIATVKGAPRSIRLTDLGKGA